MKKRRVEWRIDRLLEKLSAIHFSSIPPRAKKKEFSPSMKEVQILKDYSDVPGEEFWKRFPVNRNLRGGTPFKLDVNELRSLASLAELSCPDMELLVEVVKDIVDGADLRVADTYVPTVGKNAPSAIRDGPWVTDAVAKGVQDKILSLIHI